MIGVIKLVFRLTRDMLNVSKIFSLKLKGVHVDWTSRIHWSASVECGGGGIYIGARSSLDIGVILRAYGGQIKIGTDCTVNPYSILYGDGGLKIGNGVRIAAHTVIVPANHIFTDPNMFIFQQGESRSGILIEDDTWIGAGVQVLDGVRIEKGTVVGAGAVVTKSTEAFGIYVGVPAKKISSRLKTPE